MDWVVCEVPDKERARRVTVTEEPTASTGLDQNTYPDTGTHSGLDRTTDTDTDIGTEFYPRPDKCLG